MPSQRRALAGHSFSYPRITHDFTASNILKEIFRSSIKMPSDVLIRGRVLHPHATRGAEGGEDRGGDCCH